MVLSRINRALNIFKMDRSGVAAVEFALIAPVAMIMMMGTVELGRAVVTARRFNLVTAVISDLVARENTMSTADLDAIATAAQTIWSPYDQTTLKFQVMQIRKATLAALKIAPNTIYVDWAYSYFSASVPSQCSVYTETSIPSNMLATGAAIIIVNGSYTYKPLFGTQLPFATTANWSWTSSSSHSPRQVCTDYNKTNCLPTTCE